MSLTEAQAHLVGDRLADEGFISGFEFGIHCEDGHYGQRSSRWGQPKSDRWAVSATIVEPKWEAFENALGDDLTPTSVGGSVKTYRITEWKDRWAG